MASPKARWANQLRLGSPGAQARAALLALLAVAAGTITWASRGIGFFGDQWKWIFEAVHPTVGQAFQDWDTHLMASTFGLFDLLPRIAGLSQLWPYRVVAIVLHLGIVWAVFALASRRVGPRVALLPAAVVAFLGSGGEVFLTSLDYNALIATLACLLALLAVDRRTFRADLAACALLLVGVGSFTNALAYAAGLTVELLVRERFRRVWVTLTPVALYAIWRIEHGLPHAIPGHPAEHPVAVLKDAVRIAAGAFGGVAGLQLATMRHTTLAVLVVAVLVASAFLLAVRARLYRDPRFLNLTVTGIVLWLMIAYARGALHDFYGSRYVYQGGIVAILLLVELWVPFAGRARLAVVALVAATLTSVAFNTLFLVNAGSSWRSASTDVRAKLTALGIARDTVAPDYRPGQWTVEFVTASRYFNAVDAFGSAGLTLAQLRRDAEPERRTADRVLIGAREIRRARSTDSTECTTIRPGRMANLTVSSSRISLVSTSNETVHIWARRFATEYTRAEDIALAKGRATDIRISLGTAPDPWHLRIAVTGRTRLCSRA